MPARIEKVAALVMGTLAAAGLWYGWRLFWFLTDDAYIAFRYASNSMLGHGYVWNPPPFAPVEGYTSFLWIVLLEGIWRTLGWEPPESANVLSLIFSYLTLALGALLVLRMDLSDRLRPFRCVFLGLVLLGVITNRTFLAWTSSGLETALVGFLLTLWVCCCLLLAPCSKGGVLGIASSAALLALARPDGLLFVAMTAVLVAAALRARVREGSPKAPILLCAAPLLLVPLHLAWRLMRYGEWLPNTWLAKTDPGEMWVASGIRYLGSFITEYALWIWIAALAVALYRGRSFRRGRSERQRGAALARIAVVTALLAHLLYYTFVVGGDHFEFRVYSHLLLLLFVSFVWLLDAARASVAHATLALGLFVTASWLIPWTHWVFTKDLATREQTYRMKVSVADATARALPWLPDAALAYLRLHDRMQFWLIDRFVCMRHQEHKVFHQHLVRTLPSRDEGLLMTADDHPVIPLSNVGVAGWVLPHVAIIDRFGLNDRVIARSDTGRGRRFMGHDRMPPPGYVECFSPNVRISDGKAIVEERSVPLTPVWIEECERRFLVLVSE